MPSLLLIIDGYNLLNASDVFPEWGPATFAASRHALLDFLVREIQPELLQRTMVVFDAQNGPRGLPRELKHHGLDVRFADRKEEADDHIEREIELHNAPRTLLVVSSDHRIQRAARRRRASTMDSELWYQQQVRQPRLQQSPGKPIPPLPDSLEKWLNEFGYDTAEALWEELEAEEKPVKNSAQLENESPDGKSTSSPPQLPNGTDNPFPPHYGEDLLDEW